MSDINAVSHDVCNTEIENLKGLIEGQKQTITNLLNTLDSGESTVIVDDSQIKVKNAEIDRLNSELERLKNGTDSSKKELENMLTDFNKVLAEEGLSVEEVLSIIDARDESINQLANQNSFLANEIGQIEHSARKTVENKNKEIERLNTELADKKHENLVNTVKYASIPVTLLVIILSSAWFIRVRKERNKQKVSKLSSLLNQIVSDFDNSTDETTLDLASIDNIITLERDFGCNAYATKDIEYYNM